MVLSACSGRIKCSLERRAMRFSAGALNDFDGGRVRNGNEDGRELQIIPALILDSVLFL